MTTHPYYPPDLLLPGYVPNTQSTLYLLVFSSLVMGPFLIGAYTLARKKVDAVDASRFTWFLLSGFLHCGFEFYFLLHHATLASRTDIVAQLWKEYAHSDSRYLSSDLLVLSLETITVFILGPLCLVAAWAIRSCHQSQYVWQLIISVAHMFSCSLYFIMDYPTGFHNCDPHPMYFWVYFVTFNAFWLVVPFILVIQSYRKIACNPNSKPKVS
ncbi:Emopamil-binding protein, partial [Phycomyces nitens]